MNRKITVFFSLFSALVVMFFIPFVQDYFMISFELFKNRMLDYFIFGGVCGFVVHIVHILITKFQIIRYSNRSKQSKDFLKNLYGVTELNTKIPLN